jgi:hypothetical protein
MHCQVGHRSGGNPVSGNSAALESLEPSFHQDLNGDSVIGLPTTVIEASGALALFGAAIATSVGIGYAIGAQPHMGESIALLQSARGELQAATPNKGGHRERASGLISQANSLWQS